MSNTNRSKTSTGTDSEFHRFMMKFSNKALLGRYPIPLRQIKVFVELQRPLVASHVSTLVGLFNTNGMNHALPVNTIKVLTRPGRHVLNPDLPVPPEMVFEVWSGQHRIAAAKQYLRDEMAAVLSPVETLPPDAELGHKHAYWFADVYDRSFYEENPEPFRSFVIAENVVAQGTLEPPFSDVWGAMRSVFRQKDLTAEDRRLHYRSLVPSSMENMELVLSCEPLCEVLDELFKIPAYYSKLGKIKSAFKTWGKRGQRQLMAIILRQALDQMRALLPPGGKLEDLSEELMAFPNAEWYRIRSDTSILHRFQAAGFHTGSFHELEKLVMTMPRHRHTLSLDALKDGLSSMDSVTIKHPKELLTPKFVLTATGSLYGTVQNWVNTIFVLIAIVQGLDATKPFHVTGAGGSADRGLEKFTLGRKDDWLDALEKCFVDVLKEFPADFDQQGMKNKVLRLLYANTETRDVLLEIQVQTLSGIEESVLYRALSVEGWWQLVTLFVPPSERDKDFKFPRSKVIRPRLSPNVRAQAEVERLAAIALEEERKKKQLLEEARLRAAADDAAAAAKKEAELAAAKKEADLAAAKAREQALLRKKQSYAFQIAQSLEVRKRAMVTQGEMTQNIEEVDIELGAQKDKVEELELAVAGAQIVVREHGETSMTPAGLALARALTPTPIRARTPTRATTPRASTPGQGSSRQTLTAGPSQAQEEVAEEIQVDEGPEFIGDPVKAFRKKANEDYLIPPDAVEAMVGRLQQDMAEYIDTPGSIVFGKVLKSLIGYPTNLAQICSPHMTHAFMSVENQGWSEEKVVRVLDADRPLEPSLIAKARAAFGVKRTVDDAQHTPERQRTTNKRPKTIVPLQAMTPRDLGDVQRDPVSREASVQAMTPRAMTPMATTPRAVTPGGMTPKEWMHPMDPRQLEGLEQMTPEVEEWDLEQGSPPSPSPVPLGRRKGKGRMVRESSEGAHSQLEREADQDSVVSSESSVSGDCSGSVATDL
ncbi:hypothetical protein BS47DRAFT_1368018 [Hydnum rufescens UP504]|uniref:Uncharacterized protein n=1 Tax=Hydnum rufescens UP504 TaxID=1448309 RepID=A0A9P6AGN6_9AGAM|nr:hypothetical protein BS47DRAFT_1368018 [Hydnum rufescens UP504]